MYDYPLEPGFVEPGYQQALVKELKIREREFSLRTDQWLHSISASMVQKRAELESLKL